MNSKMKMDFNYNKNYYLTQCQNKSLRNNNIYEVQEKEYFLTQSINQNRNKKGNNGKQNVNINENRNGNIKSLTHRFHITKKEKWQNVQNYYQQQLLQKNKQQRSQLKTRSTQRHLKSMNSTRYQCSQDINLCKYYNFSQNSHPKISNTLQFCLNDSNNLKAALVYEMKKSSYNQLKQQSEQYKERIKQERQKNLIENKMKRFRVIKSRNAGRLKKRQNLQEITDFQNGDNNLSHNKKSFSSSKIQDGFKRIKLRPQHHHQNQYQHQNQYHHQDNSLLKSRLKQNIHYIKQQVLKQQQSALQLFQEQLSFKYLLMTKLINN